MIKRRLLTSSRRLSYDATPNPARGVTDLPIWVIEVSVSTFRAEEVQLCG